MRTHSTPCAATWFGSAKQAPNTMAKSAFKPFDTKRACNVVSGEWWTDRSKSMDGTPPGDQFFWSPDSRLASEWTLVQNNWNPPTKCASNANKTNESVCLNGSGRISNPPPAIWGLSLPWSSWPRLLGTQEAAGAQPNVRDFMCRVCRVCRV
jgi:hypothetical protein